jgi:hypothetical protein
MPESFIVTLCCFLLSLLNGLGNQLSVSTMDFLLWYPPFWILSWHLGLPSGKYQATEGKLGQTGNTYIMAAGKVTRLSTLSNVALWQACHPPTHATIVLLSVFMSVFPTVYESLSHKSRTIYTFT